MTILVLGNGFDIAHGLPTKYTDFLKYCHNYEDGSISDDKILVMEFSELIKDNMWLKFFIDSTPDLDEDKTWIDFEHEIYNVITAICNDGKKANTKSYGIKRMSDIKRLQGNPYFGKYILISEDRLLSYDVSNWYLDLRNFIRAFEIYCCSIINERSGITRHYKLNESLFANTYNGNSTSTTYVLSFNYTRTFSRYYDNGDSNIKYMYIYPHGEACTEISHETADMNMASNGLVLGTHSFDRNGKDKDIPIDFNVFQKHNQQHRYNTLADFQQLLKELRECEERTDIYVIGHSLDESDRAKLKHIFCQNKEANITVFYYDEVSFDKYINNITAILGEEDVAVRVKFKHQHDHVLGILLPFKVYEDSRASYEVIDEPETVLSEAISDCFINEFPYELNELSTHSGIESIQVENISKIELFEDGIIHASGNGNIECTLQYGSDADVRNDNGIVWEDSFPFEFTIVLHAEYDIEKPHNDRFSIMEIQYSIDTSGYNEDHYHG